MIKLDIARGDLRKVAEEIGATDKQFYSALDRALRRTEASLRKLSSKGLTKELKLRTARELRHRLKAIKLKKVGIKSREVGIWYGLNPLAVSSFKGRPANDPAGAFMGEFFFKDGFVSKGNFRGRNTIFKRKTNDRLPIEEQTISIHDDAKTYIEDELFDQILNIFWNHFRRDLNARVKYQLGDA